MSVIEERHGFPGALRAPWVLVVQGAIFVVCVLVFRRGAVGELGNLLKKPL